MAEIDATLKAKDLSVIVHPINHQEIRYKSNVLINIYINYVLIKIDFS